MAGASSKLQEVAAILSEVVGGALQMTREQRKASQVRRVGNSHLR
jgi:hypothetical protein